ncbi:MAG: PQQ-dependent dehydrogenase, methanol/ethanol family [Acidobacteria bacterium]|nr:MAG: PQQ-dependent dehydrogenase, methanol/ethanol family [Acidobacteriota bacterium]
MKHYRSVAVAALAAASSLSLANGPVSYERLLRADQEPGNWLMYSGNYRGHRYSRLDQITPANAHRLRPKWVYQMRTTHKVETSPLVVDGIMYLTRPPNDVVALDTETGRELWYYRYKVPDKVYVCCGQVNRGLAVLGNRLFMGTVDAKLVALDIRSGRELWKTEVTDYTQGYAVTVAPLPLKDKVIIGVAGGEYGIRGFIDAYEAETGKRAWRFYTVPGPDEPNFGTWDGDSWKTGGSSIWVTGAFDPDLNLTYWGTGNPGPDWNGENRRGDNLYSDCMVALDADTGKLRWYFQYTPHDVHDWDSVQVPVLVDAPFRGRQRKLLLHANRNGFFYVLDRATGEFLLGRPYVKQTWATGLDAKGRPVRVPETFPTESGVAVWPGVTGGQNWYSPSYSPATGLYYVAAQEQGNIYFKAEATYKPGTNFTGGGGKPIPSEPGWGAVRAIVPETGDIKWEHRLLTPPWAGLLATAGNVVFGGTTEGNFFALDARTGKHLWRFPAGGQVIANPISYSSGAKQQVAIAAGDVLIAFALEESGAPVTPSRRD